jgi:hypothetical protein
MLVFIFDPRFKNLQFIKDYVGLKLAMQVVVDYDREILMPLLLTIYHTLTPNLSIVTFVASIVIEVGVFKSLASIEELAMGLIRTELSFFRRTILLIDTFSPFAWWAKHEQQSPNLAQHVMGIVGSQIEIEGICSTSRVITCLKWC